MTKLKVTLCICTLITLVAACQGGSRSTPTLPGVEKGDLAMTLELTSSAFDQEESIPTKYTCDGQDVSPPLSWDGVPSGTESLALIVDDPDASSQAWVHWVLFNIPPESNGLSEDVSAQDTLSDGSRHGQNSSDRNGYDGPCPPSGTHRYFFKLYALDTELELQPGATKDAVLTAMEGHILDQAELMGTYSD